MEERACKVLSFRLKASQGQLQDDNFLAKLSIESEIMLILLSLAYYVFNHDLDVFLTHILVGECRVEFYVLGCLRGCLMIAKNVASELLKLLIEIFGNDHVDDETDLLLIIFITFCQFYGFLALFDQPLAEELYLMKLRKFILFWRLSLYLFLLILRLFLTTVNHGRLIFAILVPLIRRNKILRTGSMHNLSWDIGSLRVTTDGICQSFLLSL